MDASEIYSKRLNAKEVIFPKENGKFNFPAADGRIDPLGGDQDLRTSTSIREPKSRRKSPWFSWRIRRVSSTTSRLTSGCRWSDKWLMVHVRKLHIPPSRWTRSQTLVAERKSFPIPLKYIDVSRTTHTNLDVMQESRIDDYWNVDGSRDLFDYWRGFTQITLLSEKPPEWHMWSGDRLTKRQATSRPDHLWPELWIKLGRNAKMKEKRKWCNEQPKLDNARRLWGIYFIDPEDKEFKETIKNARKKLETPMAPAVPCKTSKKSKHGETRGKTNEIKSKPACILEASESTRLRMEESLPNYHEDHIARKGDNSLQHHNLVHKFIPMPQAMKIPAAKAAVDK